MREGDRREHDLALLSDWTILTPPGSITPRETAAARLIRANRDELRRLMVNSQDAGS